MDPEDGPWSRQLSTTKNPETIAQVSELVSRDQRITPTEDQLRIKQEMICHIFHDNMGKRKICIMFFCSLIEEKKECRLTTCKEFSAPVTAIHTSIT